MKITYQEKPISRIPKLKDLDTGEVFRFPNSLRIFMRCDLCGESQLLSEKPSSIWGYVTKTANDPFEDKEHFDENFDYDQLIVCVELVSGNVTLFYEGIEVEPLDCELLIKGEQIWIE